MILCVQTLPLHPNDKLLEEKEEMARESLKYIEVSSNVQPQPFQVSVPCS